MEKINSRAPADYYLSLLAQQKEKHRLLNKRSSQVAILRLLTFVIFAATGTAAMVGYGSWWWWPSLVSLAVFIWLIVVYSQMQSALHMCDATIAVLLSEIDWLSGNNAVFDGGHEFIDPTHPFSFDLDVYGDISLFSILNRTQTPGGKAMLAYWLNQPLNDANEILKRQQAVSELKHATDWQLEMRVLGKVAAEDKNDLLQFESWLRLKPLLLSQIFGILIPLVSALSILMTVLLMAGTVSFQQYLLYLILPLGITAYYTKSINRRHLLVSKKVDLLKKYARRFELIEKSVFKSAFFDNHRLMLNAGNMPASAAIEKLASIAAALDTRLNMLAGLALNALLLWDIRQVRRLEQWQQHHKSSLYHWFNVLYETEVLLSVAGFAYGKPDFIFPVILENPGVLQASDVVHPLLKAGECVSNPIAIEGRGRFVVVTGANMAGKSTYLRTVGVNLLLAQIGAPVGAVSFGFYPSGLFTSLRTSDSLTGGQSYFYAELVRLKRIIDTLAEGDYPLILLDEILKGTNSADKQSGSKALLRQLIGLGASGVIATHDLALGALESDFPGAVANFHFEAEIHNDNLRFDYRIKPGIAHNLNATFLMRKMGITLNDD